MKIDKAFKNDIIEIIKNKDYFNIKYEDADPCFCIYRIKEDEFKIGKWYYRVSVRIYLYPDNEEFVQIRFERATTFSDKIHDDGIYQIFWVHKNKGIYDFRGNKYKIKKNYCSICDKWIHSPKHILSHHHKKNKGVISNMIKGIKGNLNDDIMNVIMSYL